MSVVASVVNLGETELQSGEVLPNLKISHATFGTLNAARSNATAERFASSSKDGSVKIWNARTGKVLFSLTVRKNT